MFAMVMGAAALFMTALHAVEAAARAGAYRILGARPDTKSAMLYSLSAMTTYGQANLSGTALADDGVLWRRCSCSG